MTKVEIEIREEPDGYQLRGTIHATGGATRGEEDVANLIAAEINCFVEALEKRMAAQEDAP